MKKIPYLVAILSTLLGCTHTPPTTFPEAALKDLLITASGETTTLQSVLEQHKGKTIFIDIWASWCPDCIYGMPKVKALQQTYKDVVYVFLSLDRGEAAWHHGIKKFNILGAHYYLPSGKKSALGDFVSINWIPRYMVVDRSGKIAVFKAVKADDKKLLQALKN
jgi:thiol-disulfide isomerase/thioredoxin